MRSVRMCFMYLVSEEYRETTSKGRRVGGVVKINRCEMTIAHQHGQQGGGKIQVVAMARLAMTSCEPS